MASPWALEGFNSRAGAMTRLIGSALAKVRTRRTPAAGADSDRRDRALRHAVILRGSSNQALLDTRWGEPAVADDRPRSRR
jgi:hypothetical protein